MGHPHPSTPPSLAVDAPHGPPRRPPGPMVIDFEELDRLEAEAGVQVRTAGCGPGASLPPGFIPREKLVSSYTLTELAATNSRGGGGREV